MLKIILQDPRFLLPFNERARDLRVLNKPLWLWQRDVLAPFVHREIEPHDTRLEGVGQLQRVADGEQLPETLARLKGDARGG